MFPQKNKVHVMQLIAALEFGGAERLAATICTHLPKDKFDVSICGFIGQEGPLVKDLREKSIPYFFLDSNQKGRLRGGYYLFRLLTQKKVDVLMIHGAYPLLYCFLPAKLAGTKIVYIEHAKQTISSLRWAHFAARYFSLGASKVVCVSENLKDFFLESLKSSRSRIQVIHNGIDVQKFQTSAIPFSNSSREIVIGCVARLTEAKDHANLFAAFSEVAKKKAQVKLLLVGDGELRSVIERQIREYRLESKVEMLGSRNDIPALLGNMDIFVLPSKREGFPVSIIEAMAAGRPVVATAVGGVEEVVSSGENGLVVPPEDPMALAGAIMTLLDSPELARKMGQNAFTAVRERLSVAKMMQAYVSLFDSVA